MRKFRVVKFSYVKLEPTKTFSSEDMAKLNKAWSRGGNVLKLQSCSKMVKGKRVQRNILTYNKNKDLLLFVSPTELDGPRVLEWMNENGFKPGGALGDSAKGYFLGFSDTEGEIVVITDPPLPAQAW